MACGILVTRPGIEPVVFCTARWILNHGTTREISCSSTLIIKIIFEKCPPSLCLNAFMSTQGSQFCSFFHFFFLYGELSLFKRVPIFSRLAIPVFINCVSWHSLNVLPTIPDTDLQIYFPFIKVCWKSEWRTMPQM